MKQIIYKTMLVAGLSLMGAIALTSCNKKDDNLDTAIALKQASQNDFATNVANHDLTVAMAKDDGTDITANFAGYTFKIVDSAATATSGVVTVANDLLSVTGTWFVDESFSKITFQFPTAVIPKLIFFNKEWGFKGTSSATINLQPTDGEDDAVQFVRK